MEASSILKGDGELDDEIDEQRGSELRETGEEPMTGM